MSITELHGHLAKRLFEIGAIKFGSFRLKLHEKNPDAPLSPIYLNLRTPDNPKAGPLGPDDVLKVAEEMAKKVLKENLEHQLVVGVPNAGDPLSMALCKRLCSRGPMVANLVMIKSEDQDRRMVTDLRSGAWRLGQTVLLVDDLITQADSKLEAIKVLEAHQLRVNDVIVLVDREQGGKEQLAKQGYRLHSVFTLTELLDFYVEACLITFRKRDEVMEYLRNNA